MNEITPQNSRDEHVAAFDHRGEPKNNAKNRRRKRLWKKVARRKERYAS